MLKLCFSAFATALLLFGLTFTSYANASCIKGVGKVKTDQYEEVEEPSDEDIAKAKKLAQNKAWSKFLSSLDGDHLKAYNKEKSQILGNFNYFVPTIQFKEDFDQDEQLLKIEACINVNQERLKTALKVEPEIKSGEGSSIVGLFIARQAASAKEFKARKFTKSKSSSKTKSKEMARASGGKALSATSQKQMSKSESGGSVTRKSDKISYKIISPDDMNGALSSALVKAGYELEEYGDIAMDPECGKSPSPEQIDKTFASSDRMTRRQWFGAWKAAKRCEVMYFAVGTMTADVARTHQSGMKMVYVRIKGKIYSLAKRRPKQVSIIPPQQFAGLGPNEDVARTNALIKAGKRAGKIIAGELRKKGLR